MLLFFILNILAELNETGYLYSVGKKKFLSLDGDEIRIVPKYVMPTMFEIETRQGDSSYTLRIYPTPRQGDKVVDKDWYWNDHKLIIHPTNDWQSEHFIFSLVPKNMLKIIVKEKCVEVTEDGFVKAKDCLSKKDGPNQYYRWFNKNDKFLVEEFVERHSGKPNKKHNDDPEYNSDEFNKPRKRKSYESYGNRPETRKEDDSSSDFFKRPRRNESRPRKYREYDSDEDFNPRQFRKRKNSADRNIIYRYNNNEYPKKRRNNNDTNDDDDICSGMVCDPYNKRGIPDRDYQNNNYNQNSISNNNYKNSNNSQTNLQGKNQNIKNNRERLDCDDIIDGIENLICDIDNMPSFFS